MYVRTYVCMYVLHITYVLHIYLYSRHQHCKIHPPQAPQAALNRRVPARCRVLRRNPSRPGTQPAKPPIGRAPQNDTCMWPKKNRIRGL